MADDVDLAVRHDASKAENSALREIMVNVYVGGKHPLLIMLNSDGSIRRLGTQPADLLTGTTSPELFKEVCAKITPQLLQWCRPSRACAAPCGTLRGLEVRLKHSDGLEVMTHWRYDSESDGPPPQVVEFAASVVEATNRWYDQQKKMECRKLRRDNPWWQFFSAWPV